MAQRRQLPRNREVQEGWVAKVPPPPELPRPEAVLVAKPRLNDEVEALFAEAAALVASRPRRNTRLQILEEEMQRHGAAKKIGTAWRQQAQNRQQRAAQLLQNHFRGWRARRVVQREREKQRASRLQRWWRKKRFYLAWLQTHQQRKAAVKLQAFHRGNKARQEVYNMLVLRSWAVLRMQAVFRGQRARRKAQKQQQCARKIQAHWRWHRLWQAYLRERQRRRGAAATKLQALIRGFVARCRFLRMAAAKARVTSVEQPAAEALPQSAAFAYPHNPAPPVPPQHDSFPTQPPVSQHVFAQPGLQHAEQPIAQQFVGAAQPMPQPMAQHFPAQPEAPVQAPFVAQHGVQHTPQQFPAQPGLGLADQFGPQAAPQPTPQQFVAQPGLQPADQQLAGQFAPQIVAQQFPAQQASFVAQHGAQPTTQQFAVQPDLQPADQLGLQAAPQPTAQQFVAQPGRQPADQQLAGQFAPQIIAQQFPAQQASFVAQHEVQPTGQQFAGQPGLGPADQFGPQAAPQPTPQQFVAQPGLQPADQQLAGQPAPQTQARQVPAQQASFIAQHGVQPTSQQFAGQPGLGPTDQFGPQAAPQPTPQQFVAQPGLQPADQQLAGQPAPQTVAAQPGAPAQVPFVAQYAGQSATQQPGLQPGNQTELQTAPLPQATAQQFVAQRGLQPMACPSISTALPAAAAASQVVLAGSQQTAVVPVVESFRFSTECKGQSVRLSSDALLAKHIDPQEEVLQGVVFCTLPMPAVNQGWYFAVQVETTQNTELDGLVVGITTTPPSALARASPEGFEAADDVPNSWSFGYNGQMRIDEVDDAIPISWNPKDLQKGDVVGLFVSAEGEGRIYQNDALKLSKVSGLPCHQALYPFIDLLGNTVAVRLLPTAQPPGGTALDALEPRLPDGPEMAPALTYDFSTSQLTAFALQPRPKDVILSAEMLLVKRKSNIFSQDLVYGNGVAPSSPLGSYFEVRLESAVSRGFALGFQAANAVGTKLTEAPATACSLGFDGMAFIGGNSILVSDWPSRPWLATDRLGLLAAAGYLALAVNDQWLVEVPGAIPEGPLVPFVDLGGGPMAISLEVAAEPPKGGALSGFHRRLCSPLVTLEGKTKATRTGVHPKGAGLGCVLFGDGPVPSFPEGRYFEVCIEEVTKVFADGLNIGVAVGLPNALPDEAYATCEEVPRSFCYGFDGMAHRHDMEDMIPIDWSPENLEIGDAVGILVTAEGVMQLIVNGTLEAQAIDRLPGEELFPLVELMGNTVAVSIRPGAAPPAIREKVKEVPEEPAQPEVAEAPTAPAPMPMPTETVPHAAAAELAKPQAHERPSVAKSQQRPETLSPPRRSTLPRQVPVKASDPAFCAQLLSKQMQLSKDGNSVRHKDETGRELYGIAMGNSPLIPFPAGRYFEVRVDRVRENMPDGLAMGFTLVPPNELAGEDPHEVSDTLPESWTAGYDGFYRSVNFAEGEQVRVGWKPSSLEVNDRVGALLSRAGQFVIVVNGKVVVRLADEFPLADVEAFYPVVDLLGRVCQVTMVRDAVPPAAAVDGTIFTGFDPKLLGKAVSLSNGRLLCSSSDPVGKELGGVVFGDGPLPCTGPDGEAYFEVVVEELRRGNDDGLVLGVASKRPQAMDDILMGCDVKEAWSIGYNGCSFSPDEEEDVPVKWSPVNLQRGDHVGLLIQGDGSMIVLVNASPVCKGPKKPPVLDKPLYPFVDLLGNTKAVQLVTPAAELVKTAVANCAKAVKRSLVSGGKDPAFFDAW